MKIFFLTFIILFPQIVLAKSSGPTNLDSYYTTIGYTCLLLFIISYLFVMFEEKLRLKKTVPVIFSAGLIWTLVAYLGVKKGMSEEVVSSIKHNIVDFAEIALFLLVAMTYVNAMQDRNVFQYMRAKLVCLGLSYRQLFWILTIIAFVLSPIADNLTTALFMGSIVIAIGANNINFITITLIAIVISSNAGGAFSPFGDITTLMVWQKGILKFNEFFYIFVPSLVNYIVPIFIMQFYIPRIYPDKITEEVSLKYGAKRIVLLFLLTIITAVLLNNYLSIPPMVGMMFGLSYLFIFSYYVQCSDITNKNINQKISIDTIFDHIKNAEWDTLLFFYGIIMCVGGLSMIGYLELVSDDLYYNQWSNSISRYHQMVIANSLVGVISAVFDNIPIMFSILAMYPEMSDGQWLLITLTAGVGGSLLSIGSAAGVALMGIGKKYYTFMTHLKWSGVIFLGYILSILTHLYVNKDLFTT